MSNPQVKLSIGGVPVTAEMITAAEYVLLMRDPDEPLPDTVRCLVEAMNARCEPLHPEAHQSWIQVAPCQQPDP